MSVFDKSSLNDQQRAITQRGEDICEFPWERLVPGLRREVGRSVIPVDWSDLSRWTAAANEAFEATPDDNPKVVGSTFPLSDHEKQELSRAGVDHDHDGQLTHWHVTDGDGNEGHVLAGEINGRRAALGLAWYSGRISIEQTLVNNPDLAIEVFLAEGAHMVDFFYMTQEMRNEIFDEFHHTPDHLNTTQHGHGWFEETGNQNYWSWVGESFMAGFMMAYAPGSPMPLFPRQPWEHRATSEIASEIKRLLTLDLWQKEREPKAPEPEPESEPEVTNFVGVPGRKVYHRPLCPSMYWSKREQTLSQPEVNQRRPCRLCKPVN